MTKSRGFRYNIKPFGFEFLARQAKAESLDLPENFDYKKWLNSACNEAASLESESDRAMINKFIGFAQENINPNDYDQIKLSMIQISERMVDSRSRELLRAHFDVIEGGKKGHEIEHGTTEEKNERWNEYQRELERVMAENHRLNVSRAREKVAKTFEVSKKTIERHTKDPRRN